MHRWHGTPAATLSFTMLALCFLEGAGTSLQAGAEGSFVAQFRTSAVLLRSKSQENRRIPLGGGGSHDEIGRPIDQDITVRLIRGRNRRPRLECEGILSEDRHQGTTRRESSKANPTSGLGRRGKEEAARSQVEPPGGKHSKSPDKWHPKIKGGFCRHPEGCFKAASYGHPETLQRLYCSNHRLPGHLNVKHVNVSNSCAGRNSTNVSRKRKCVTEGCDKSAVYGPASVGRAIACAGHRRGDHVDVTHKRCQSASERYHTPTSSPLKPHPPTPISQIPWNGCSTPPPAA